MQHCKSYQTRGCTQQIVILIASCWDSLFPGVSYCDGRGVYADIIGLKTMQWEMNMYAYVRT